MTRRKLNSWYAGQYDTQKAIGVEPTHTPEQDFDYPDEDSRELDEFQYMRGQINALIERFKELTNLK